MVFFNQLCLLLWKNYTLKKRKPFIFIAELTVPLILFLILVLIREHRPPSKAPEDIFPPMALPSAGIIPLLQSFCKGDYPLQKNGYRAFPNSSIERIMKDFADVTNTPVFNAIIDLKKLESDFEDFENDPEYSKNIRRIRNIKFSDLLRKDSDFQEYLIRNLSVPSNLSKALVDGTFNGTEISSILLEKNEGFLQDYIQEVVRNKAPIFSKLRHLQQSTLMQILFDPTSLVAGPVWLKFLSLMAKSPSMNPLLLEDSFKSIFLNASDISYLSCDKDVFNKLVLLNNASNIEKVELQEFLCNLTATEDASLAQELKTALNWTSILEKFKTTGPSMAKYEEKARIIREDLFKLSNLEDAFHKLTILAKDLNLNLSQVAHSANTSRPFKIRKNANELWKTLSPVLCGKSYKSDDKIKDVDNQDSIVPELIDGSGETSHALKVMLYMLTHDPMVLYSPNGTDVDKIIKKSGFFLKVMQDTKDLTKEWLKLSVKFSEFIKSEKTQQFLKQLYKSVDRFPFMYDPRADDISNQVSFLPKMLQKYLRSQNVSHIFDLSNVIDYQRRIANNTRNKLYDYITQHNNTADWAHVQIIRKHLKKGILMMMPKENGNTSSIEVLDELGKIDYMAKGWQLVLKPMKLNLYYGFPNETMLNKYIENRTESNNPQKPLLSAIVFDNIRKDGKLPKHVHYRIRMDGRVLFSTGSVRSRYWVPGPLSGNSKYYYYGFAWMQDQLERAIIELMTGRNVSSPGLYVQEIPYPCYLRDNFMFVIQYIMPLCVVISFIYSVAILVQSIVYEKEQRLKEVMKMMGLSNAVHWTSWFITSIVVMMTIVILLTIVLKTGQILPSSNSYIIFVFLTLAAIATIMFCFLISIFFSKAKLAAACGGIIYFVTYMPYIFISIQEGGSNHVNIGSKFKTIASFFSTTAFGLGARYFALFEQNGVGLQWSNLSSSPIEGDEFNMGKVFTMLIADTFIYAILVWYIEAIHPGTYGIPRPWYFPFQLSYWFGPQVSFDCDSECCCKPYRRVSVNHNLPQNTPALLAVENEPTHLKLGVSIDNLLKIYKKGLPAAVDHLSLNLYEGQIMSFLGHNGAGKTTTMSLLTGLFPSTSGTAFIYGNDIHNDMDKIRKSLGLCPQHNVLYGKLTVEETLWFYARLKGMSQKQVEFETARMLEDIGLPEKSTSFVETLSGGMKRKLSVAIAFVGGSQTVILDEPTAGVDPYARRAIWELLEKYKSGRTILLSTHFMDEADILGDRIAIISHGKLRCVGSSLFLKTKFGDGYHLTIVKEKETTVPAGVVTKFIQSHVINAQIVCESKYELSYILPDKGKENKDVLKKFFTDLEAKKGNLGVKSFGLQDTTLEEVFLKVTEATVAGEDNDLTAKVDTTTPPPPPTLPTSLVSTNSSIDIPLLPRSPERSDSATSDERSLILNDSPTAHLIQTTPVKKPSHRRAFSTDLDLKPKPVTGHRRTPSGTYYGHRRALSSDLTFSLTRGDINSPEHVKKVSSHKRMPSGTAKIQPIGSESWSCHVGASSSLNINAARWQQFYALILKRVHHSKRNIKALLNHILLPGIFVSIAMTVALSQPKVDTYPNLVLSPTMFHPPPYYIPFSNSNPNNNISRLMEESLYLPSGINSDCVLKSPNMILGRDYDYKYVRENLDSIYDPFCKIQVGRRFNMDLPTPVAESEGLFNSSLYCNCTKNWQYNCPAGIGGKPESFNVVTMDTLQNIADRDFLTYLLYTNDLYRRKRYGALTFGDEQNNVPPSVILSRFDEIKRLYAKESVRVWFSNKGYHSMPAFINAMDNALLRAMVTPEMGNPAAYGITASSHPLNLTKNVLNMDSIKQGTDAIIAIFVIIAMSFVPASFVVFLVMERTTKAKHIQFVSGLNPILYWLSNYIWDFLNFMIPALACMFIFHAFAVPAYASKANFPAVCALFICYGWSITPMMYPASFIFREASTGFVVLILLNLFLGITCTVTVSILQLFPNDPQLKLAFEIVKIVSLLFPNYCLGRGLMDLAYNELLNQVYLQTGKFDQIRSPFEWAVVTRSLVFMITEGIIFFIVTLIIEYLSSVRRKTIVVMDSNSDGEDIDVAAERQRVLSGGADDDVMRIENLTKIYNSRKTGKHLAVNRLSLGVTRGECFGLLGVNGAGKTTTFKMLTGDIRPTAGDAYVENKSISHNPLSVHQKIGYCPQFDALFDHLTAEEHLYLYARLKGIPELEIGKIVTWLIKKMALTRYANKPSKTYSGGNKRKLSAAIALLGNPSVIFMDEPTTGMDPGARRFLWNVILSIIKEGTKSVVLTSHSMEECEALCTRLAIMVNGEFKCMGSTQHIKDRFGDGYIVIIRIKGSLPDLDPIKHFMESTFDKCILKESHHNVVQYQIPSCSRRTLSDIFGVMEDACEKYNIEDYSVSQTSLDNVFVNFARNQRESTLDSDPSFIGKTGSKIRKSRIRHRKMWNNLKSKKDKAKVRLTKLSTFPPSHTANGDEDLPGQIGANEDEITLEEIDPLSFIDDEAIRLTMDV